MGFGPSSKFPTMGMVPPSRFAPMGMVQDPEEMAMMMGAQNRPRVAQHAQASPIPPQASASPIRAPKDKAMGFLGKFGRILAGGAYGGENMGWIERLGRGPEGMNAVRDEIRAGKKTAEEEARRQQMLQQFAGMEGLTPQQQMLIRNGFGVEQLAERQFATPAAAKFGLDLKEVTDPVTGEKRLVQASEAGGVRAVEGFVPAPPAPDQRPWWAQEGGGVDPAQLANQAAGRSPGVNINMPGEGPQETAFMREAGALEAKNFGSLVEMGQTSRRNRVILDQLDSSAATIPGGWQAVVQNELGNLGIDTEGLSEIQATEALINQLVPAQRQPGSGPMSDKDLALFKASLPRLIQTPEGKTRILNNMKAINDYVISEGEIGSRVLSGEITPEQGRAEMQALGNPLAGDPRTGAPTGPQKEDLKGLRAPDGDPVTEEDIAETMRKYNVSREAVIAHLRGQ